MESPGNCHRRRSSTASRCRPLIGSAQHPGAGFSMPFSWMCVWQCLPLLTVCQADQITMPVFADRKRDSAKGCTDGEKLIAQPCLRAIYATLIFGLSSQEMPRVLRLDRSSRVRRLWECRWTGYPYHDHHRLRQGPMDATKHPEHCFEEGFAWMGSGQSCQAPIRRKRCLWTKPLCPPRVIHGRCRC